MGFGGSSTGGSFGNGATGDSGGEGGCFVATACYGEHSNITDSLRLWRDEVLRGNQRIKKIFIKMYYMTWGKPGGWLLRKLPFLRPAARRAILFFIRINKIDVQSQRF